MAAESNPSGTLAVTAREESRPSIPGSRGAAPVVRTPTQTEHVRETADSIVVAFILAFVFRAFIIEAFVIPTGSMAATLYGRHGTMICHDCGWEFAYGLTDPASRPGEQPRYGPNEVAQCPNCAHANSIAEINDSKGNSEAGDRILALKWPYDVGGKWLGPHRWDVALFKDPSDTELNDGVTNFIKRMVGLPHEVLEIIDGDVYSAPVDKLSPAVIAALDEARHAKYLRQYESESREAYRIEQRLRTIWPEVLKELSQSLQICRKTALAQKALWSVVYNHDFPPQSLDSHQPFWGRLGDESGGWDVSGRRIRFAPRGAALEGVALRNRPVLDENGYNLRSNGEPCGVTDLRIRMVLTRGEGEGALLLKLPKRERAFWVELVSDGTLRLFQTDGSLPAPSQEPWAAAKLSALQAGQAVEVDFQNVDYRVSVSIDGQELLATTTQQFAPEPTALRGLLPNSDAGEVEIVAHGMALELSHVVVERDVYYRSPRRHLGPLERLSRLTGTVWGGTGNPILLRDGEYFMLGDNSPASGDSRLWSVIGKHLEGRGEACQLGTVPSDQLIGRAFFVYWPSGHRSDIIPLLDRVGLIPDVGRMRWIR